MNHILMNQKKKKISKIMHFYPKKIIKMEILKIIYFHYLHVKYMQNYILHGVKIVMKLQVQKVQNILEMNY